MGGTAGGIAGGLQLGVWWHEHLPGDWLDLCLLYVLHLDLLSLGDLFRLLWSQDVSVSFGIGTWQCSGCSHHRYSRLVQEPGIC